MSFVSDELAKALKSAYMVEESDQRGEGVYPSSKVDKKHEDSSKEKRPRKHKHRKHSKSKSKDRKKSKKRKRKSRSPASRSRSESRSKSRSRSSERVISFKSEERRCPTSKSRSKSPKKTRTSCASDGEFVPAKEGKLDELLKEEMGKSRSGIEIEIDLKQGAMSTLLCNALNKHQKESEGIDSQNSQEEYSLKFQKDDMVCAKSSGNCKTSVSESPHSSNAEKLMESNSQHQTEGSKQDKSQSRSQSQEHSGGKRSSSVSSKASDVEVSNSKKTNSSSKLPSKSRSASKDISKEKKSSPKTPFKESSSTRNSQPRSHSKNQSKKEKTTRSPSNCQPSRRRKSRSRSCSYHKESRSRSKSRSWNKRSHSKSSKESESRSRSRGKRSRSRSKSRSKSCSKRKRSHSKSRSRSRHKRSRSRHKRRDSRSRSRSRSYRRYKSRSRSHSRRKRSCSNSRRRSPTHRHQKFSPPRWKRKVGSSRRFLSRSPSREGRGRHKGRSRSRSYSRSRSRSWSRRRRSRSFSRGRRRSRSCSYSRVRVRKSSSQDRQKGRNKAKSRSKSKEKTESKNTLTATSGTTGIKISSVIDKPVATTMTSQQSKIAARSGGKTIAELTAFCKKLADEKEGDKNDNSTVTGAVKEDSPPVTHHPFLLKEKPDISIPPVIFPVKHVASLSVDANKPLQEVFPVSCGSKHRENEIVNQEDSVVPNIDGSAAIQGLQQKSVFQESSAEKFDISELVAKRMEAQRRLETNPNDIESILTLQEIQMKMQNWCQSNVKPGQFTGELVKSLLPKEDLNGGYQAWAKKDMFRNLAPVTGGIGMKLLQKMGWKPGQVIGKRGEGFAEPIALTVKIDRKGLSTVKEKPTKKTVSVDLQGKHPVSALAEFCSKRKWPLPDYSLVFDHGPAHSKQFLFKVLVHGTEYQPAVVCGNKKQAKAEAAIFALQGLGLIPEDTEISAM